MVPTIRIFATADRIPPGELPSTPDEIDLDRVVHDPDYRRAVKDLLRRWGIGNDRPRDRH